jgi:hypothetical protein
MFKEEEKPAALLSRVLKIKSDRIKCSKTKN